MDKKRHIFDDFLNGSLANLQGEVNPGDWDRIASALDQMDASNSAFDESIGRVAAHTEGPVTEEDWKQVESALNRKKRRIVAMWWSIAGLLLLTSGLWFVSIQNNRIAEDKVTLPVEVTGDQNNEASTTSKDIVKTEEGSGVNQAEETPVSSQLPENKELANTIDETPSETETHGPKEIKHPSTRSGETSTKQPDAQSGTPKPAPTEAIWLTLKQPYFGTIPVNLEMQGLIAINNAFLKEDKQPFTSKNPTWEFGLRATPNLGLLQSVANPELAWRIHKDYFNITQGSEKATNGYTFGFNALRYLNSRFYIASGIYFSQKVERVDYKYTITEYVDVDEPAETIRYYPKPVIQHQRIEYDGINTFNFVEIPVKFGTIVPFGQMKNWEWRAETGVSFMALVSASGKKPDQTFLELYDIAGYDNMKRMAIGMELKGGLYYKGVSHFRFGFEPAFAMTLTSLYNNDAPTKLRPYNYGLNLTANYILFGK